MSRLKSVPPDSLFLFLALYGGAIQPQNPLISWNFRKGNNVMQHYSFTRQKKTFDSNMQDLNNIGLRIQNVKFEIFQGCFSCVIQNWIKDIFDLLLILLLIFQKKNNNLFVFSKLSCNCIPFYHQLKKGTN